MHIWRQPEVVTVLEGCSSLQRFQLETTPGRLLHSTEEKIILVCIEVALQLRRFWASNGIESFRLLSFVAKFQIVEFLPFEVQALRSGPCKINLNDTLCDSFLFFLSVRKLRGPKPVENENNRIPALTTTTRVNLTSPPTPFRVAIPPNWVLVRFPSSRENGPSVYAKPTCNLWVGGISWT